MNSFEASVTKKANGTTTVLSSTNYSNELTPISPTHEFTHTSPHSLSTQFPTPVGRLVLAGRIDFG